MPARARLHSNWVYFAVIYTIMAFVMGAVSVGLDLMFHVTGGEIGLTIGGYMAAAILAGLRYVRSHGNVWTARERHHLALVYALTSFLVSALVMGAVSVVIFLTEGSVDQLLSLLTEPQFLIFLAISLTVGLAVYYGLARFSLFVVDRAAHAGAGQSS
jgi:hypothetical protein